MPAGTVNISAIDPTGSIPGSYLTLAAWETAVQGDLVTDDRQEIAEVYSGGSVGPVVFSKANWTTDSDRYPIIRAATGHEPDGDFSNTSTVAYLDAGGTHGIQADIDHLVIETLYLTGATSSDIEITSTTTSGTVSLWKVNRCMFRSGATQNIYFNRAYIGTTTNYPGITNCAIINTAGGGVAVRARSLFTDPGAILLYTYNNTISMRGGAGIGIVSDGTGSIVFTKNNYYGFDDLFFGSCANITNGGRINVFAGTSTLATSDATNRGITGTVNTVGTPSGVPTAGLSSVPFNSTTFFNVGSGVEDFQLVSGSTLLDNANAEDTTSLAGSEAWLSVTEDLVGNARSFPGIDIGAHEFSGIPVAFTADTVSGTIPLTVNFTNLTLGATIYKWDFGDGDISADENPTHVYDTAGTYSVTLTVEEGTPDEQSLTKTNYITASPPPGTFISDIKPDGSAAEPDADFLFTSLSAWQTARARNLVGMDQIEIARVWPDPNGVGAGTLVLDDVSWTTDKEHYIQIIGGEPLNGDFTDTTTNPYIDGTGQNYGLDVRVENVEVQGIYIQHGTQAALRVGVLSGAHIRPSWVVNRCMLRTTGGITVDFDGANIAAAAPQYSHGLINSFVINDAASSGIAVRVKGYVGKTARVFVVNNTIVARGSGGLALGPTATGAQMYTRNNYVAVTDSIFGNVFNPSPSGALLNNSTGPGSNQSSPSDACNLNTTIYPQGVSNAALINIAYSTSNFSNVTDGTENLNLVGSGVSLVDNVNADDLSTFTQTTGLESTADWFETLLDQDIHAQTRDIDRDIGADEFVTADVDFTSDVTTGIGTQDVQFTDATSAVTPTSWDWDFGDGETSTLQNPLHNYDTPGVYDVILVANQGLPTQGSETKTNYITISSYTVDFSADVTDGVMPLEVTFTDATSGSPLTWLWDFGDGNTSTDQNPTHEYELNGIYTVTLTVDSGLPSEASTTKVNYITVLEALVANFTVNPSSGTAPLTVSFTNTSNFVATEFLWDFGDPASGSNTISTLENPVHEYSAPGSYTVSFTASNPSLGTFTTTKTNVIVVSYPAPTASFIASPVSGFEPLTVQFTDTSSGPPTSWLWDFGDGGTSSSQNPQHTFATDGNYIVALTASNPTDDDTAQTTITVIPIPDLIADFHVGSLSSGDGTEINATFVNTSKEGAAYLWDFGDPDSGASNQSTEENPTHIYPEPGRYEVILTVYNGPFSNTICKNILVTLDVLRYQEIWGTARFADGTPVDADRVVSVGMEISALEFVCEAGATDPFHSYKTISDVDSTTGEPVTRFIVRSRGNLLNVPDSGFEDGDPVFLFIGGRAATNNEGDPISVPFFQTLPSNPRSSIELDIVFPLASSEAIPSSGTFDNDVSITLTSNVLPATIWYTVDGSDPKISPTRQQFIGPIVATEGTTVIKFYTEDPLGPDEDVKQETYIVNGPLVTTDVPPGTYSSPQQVTLTGNRSGIVYYQLNGTGSFVQFVDPISINPGQTGMQVTTIKAYLIDNNSNVGVTQTFEYTVDLINPTIQSFTINNGDDVTATQIVTVQIEASSFTNSVTGLLLSTLSDFSDATVQLYKPEVTFTLPPPDGSKTLYARVFDQFDPPRASAIHTDSIDLDTESPTITVSSGPTTPIGSSTYMFSGTKSAGSGILTRQNGGSEVLIISPGLETTWEHTVTLIEGTNTIDFQGVTIVGNKSSVITRSITVHFIPEGVTEATTITNSSGVWRVPFVFFEEKTGNLQERQHNFKITVTADSGPDPVITFPTSEQVLNQNVVTVLGTAKPGSIITLRVEPN